MDKRKASGNNKSEWKKEKRVKKTKPSEKKKTRASGKKEKR